ncbi:MAG: AAA family ATPase [Opitutaceae bacterium]
MTSPSEDFKKKLLAPIDELFKEAVDGLGPPSASGGRNWQMPEIYGVTAGSTKPSADKRSKKAKLGKVDEAALREAMTQLNSLIGLTSVKTSLHRLTQYARIESERRRLKLPSSGITFHTVFAGSPGTGKTSVARLLGKILKSLGLLEDGHTLEVSKADICGKYLGETPHLVKEAFDKAEGGVLFIDEAYSLLAGHEDQYGREAIDAIVQHMENQRERVVVIVAGYPAEMRKFVNSNPGLRSRFTRNVFFPDYSADELHSIMKQLCLSKGFETTQGFLLRSEIAWGKLVKQGLTSDANGRLVRSAFEYLLENQAIRLAQLKRNEPHQLCELLPEDWEHVEEHIEDNHHD